LPADPDGFGNKEDEKMANTSETSSNVTSGSSGKRRRTDGLTYLGPKDAQFDLYILGAVGVFIGDFRRIWRPDDMPQDEVEDDPSLQSEVHLKIDKSAADKISDQVTQFHLRGYDETALTTTMIKYLAPFDAYVHRSGPAVVASLCREKWKLAKQGPTVPTTQGYTYDWEIVPDATYMVSVNMFEQDLREDLRTPTFAWVLAEPYGVAPYLTVEYKCSQKSGKDSEARSQIAVASMLWINERRKLKEALGTNPSDTTDLRHYSLIVNSLSFSIWLTKFNGKAYSVEQIDVGSFNFAEGVEKYVVWWNAIHKWGLGPNARSFKRDVELLWKKVDSPDLELTPPLTVEQ